MRIALLVFVACVSGCSAASSQAVDDFPIESDSGSDAGAQAAPDSAAVTTEADATPAVDSSADAADARYGKYGYGNCWPTIPTCPQWIDGFSGECDAGQTQITCGGGSGLQNPTPAYAKCGQVGQMTCTGSVDEPIFCCAN